MTCPEFPVNDLERVSRIGLPFRPGEMIMQTRRMADVNGPDHRDPRGLRTDAPLLDAWLRFTGEVEAGRVMPMSVPGHKQRQDLVGTVVAGDAPLYGGLDTMKHADVLPADAAARAAAPCGADWCR